MRYKGFGKWLDQLETFLERQPKVVITKRTKFSVQFKFDDIIDVDLLVSPYWNNQHDFYDFLRGVPKEERYEWVQLTVYIAGNLNGQITLQLQIHGHSTHTKVGLQFLDIAVRVQVLCVCS